LGSLRRPAIAFAATAVAGGVIVTFLPVSLGAAGSLTAFSLLVQSTVTTVSRWWVGRHIDRHGSRHLLVPAVLAAAIGLGALAFAGNPFVVVAAMVVFGAGFGVAQGASLTDMYVHVPASGYGAASALWNLAYDGGIGIGAAGFGALLGFAGAPPAYVFSAALVALAAITGRHRRRHLGSPAAA
jgi:predicted MFS family arabinose efflux permease